MVLVTVVQFEILNCLVTVVNLAYVYIYGGRETYFCCNCTAGGVVGGRGEWGTLLEASNWTPRCNMNKSGIGFTSLPYMVW